MSPAVGLQNLKVQEDEKATQQRRGSVPDHLVSDYTTIDTTDTGNLENGNGISTSIDSATANTHSVTWEDPAEQDPENPMSWTARQKWGIVGILSFFSFLTPLASSMMAPAVPQILEDFEVTDTQLGAFCVSVFVLGFASGPLVVAPLSELYGRTIVYHASNILFTIFTIACALSTNMSMLIAFRFLAGFAGVSVLTCGSGTIADLMPPETRGRAMGIWSLGPLIGPVVGPVCAGFLVAAKSWQWVFWIIAIVSGATTIISLFVFRETYAPVLLERKAARLRKETGDLAYHSSLQAKGTPTHIFVVAFMRPTKMIIFAPIVTAVCLYIAVIYGLMYILFTTFTFVYEEEYGFNSQGAGLSFIAGGVGNVLGLAYVSVLSDKIVQKRKAANKAPRPEDRLHPLLSLPTTILLPTGLIIYGWTAEKHVHWIVPMLGTGIMGWGMLGIFMCCQTYLVDAYTRHAASVTAANAVLRSILGATLPLCGMRVYDTMGLGWGNTLLGLIALVFAPVPWVLGMVGERVRRKWGLREF